LNNKDSVNPSRNKALSLMFKIDAIICCIVGLGIGLLALAGPLGIWLGFSDFRAGFGFLQIVNAWSPWIAGVTLVVALGILIASKVLSIENGSRLCALALVGTLSAALAYFVPESFRPSDGTPPIHDITTNPANPPAYVAIVPLRADAPNTMVYGSGQDMTAQKLTAFQQSAYPDIIPQRFTSSVEEVFASALSAMESLGWDIVDSNLAEGRIEATDTTFWFRFKDDVVVYISREGSETVLNARSLSRVGISDVGKNTERLRAFFALL
jgi:uncharacterized protein (DUF1499 family)